MISQDMFYMLVFLKVTILLITYSLLKTIFKTYGFPLSIYYDNDSKYNYIKHNPIRFDLLKEDEDSVIQPFALKELNIRLINSKPYQPQGKGKIERKFLTFQKQLPFFLKLRKAQNIEQANEINYNNKVYLVPKYEGCSLAHRKVEIRENPGKWIKIFYNNKFLIRYPLIQEKEYA